CSRYSISSFYANISTEGRLFSLHSASLTSPYFLIYGFRAFIQGLRVLLHSIQQAASRHSRVIEPLISLSVDFYARVFVRLWSSPGAVKGIAAKHAICYTCSGCGSLIMQPLGHAIPGPRRVAPARGPPVGPSCAVCNSPFLVSGPLWNGPLHSRSFLRSFLDSLGAAPDLAKSDEVMKPPHENASVATENGKQSDPTENNYPLVSELLSQLPEGYSYSSGLTKPELPTDLSHILGTFKRIVGMCTVAYEELPDVTLCYRSDHLSAVLGTVIPPMLDLYSALLNAGYRVSSSHTDMNVFKTDAPISFIWDVFLAYRNRIRSEERMNIDQKRLPVNECNSDKKDSHDSDGDHDAAVNPSIYLESNRQRKRRLRRSRSGGDLERDGLQAEEVEENYRHNRHIVRAKLLSRPLNPRVDFTIHPLANPPSRVAGLIRYQMKPEKFWGPKARPKLSKTES
ncbi:tRNA (Guanine(26)-N(2))-dimethyltransferase, partial [Fasciola gigantica]